jgi:DNA mismatch endonuclease, patch repair protein
MALRRALHARGLRYRVSPKGLPGRPDVAFTRVRLAVFVDGCFWHGCPEHGTVPKNNNSWWTDKFSANRRRDLLNEEALISMGWVVMRVWEHEDPNDAADRVTCRWNDLTETTKESRRTGRVL